MSKTKDKVIDDINERCAKSIEDEKRYAQTIEDMCAIAEKFYPMGVEDRKTFKELLGQEFGYFIEGCEPCEK